MFVFKIYLFSLWLPFSFRGGCSKWEKSSIVCSRSVCLFYDLIRRPTNSVCGYPFLSYLLTSSFCLSSFVCRFSDLDYLSSSSHDSVSFIHLLGLIAPLSSFCPRQVSSMNFSLKIFLSSPDIDFTIIILLPLIVIYDNDNNNYILSRHVSGVLLLALLFIVVRYAFVLFFLVLAGIFQRQFVFQ